jgi:hypothetical protein
MTYKAAARTANCTTALNPGRKLRSGTGPTGFFLFPLLDRLVFLPFTTIRTAWVLERASKVLALPITTSHILTELGKSPNSRLLRIDPRCQVTEVQCQNPKEQVHRSLCTFVSQESDDAVALRRLQEARDRS